MSISRLALLAVLSTAVPPIVRRLQTPPDPAPVPARLPDPKPDPKLANDVIESLDRIGELGPSLLVWHECERLRSTVSSLVAA